VEGIAREYIAPLVVSLQPHIVSAKRNGDAARRFHFFFSFKFFFYLF
jgi:hypothetical protein